MKMISIFSILGQFLVVGTVVARENCDLPRLIYPPTLTENEIFRYTLYNSKFKIKLIELPSAMICILLNLHKCSDFIQEELL